ncbi:sugar O-acetyltransferase [Nocardioides sp. Root151]|uniref:sugar O-acetyltransferase n=1 Tax=Nocardioides sp. Root151 TaxID=1736475 RepID=UPI000A64449D|nr:sugar O-acetyltransferase [Nocardioides sp. Root151]
MLDRTQGEAVAAMSGGDWYLDSPELARLRDECGTALDTFNSAAAADHDRRREVLDALLGGLGEGAEIVPRFRCSYGFHVTIGAGAFVNADAFFMDDAPIVIGDHVRLGPSVQLMTALHPVEEHAMRRQGWEQALGIEIGENAWLGAGVIVGPGVTIGLNTVVGAGSLVLSDLPDHVVAVGSPAVVVRDLPAE